MCDDRERLIGYVYDECDRDERRVVEAHLQECSDCRTEIGGLRQTRQDLLAWDVPEHDPIWRPMAAPRVEVWWRHVPAWAMTAAAGLVFAAGMAGGVAARMLMPGAAPVTAAVAPGASATPVAAAVTQQDLAGVEARILDRLRTEMTQQLQTVAAHDAEQSARTMTASNRGADARVDVLARQVADIQSWRQKQVSYNVENENWKRRQAIAALTSQQLESSRFNGMQPVSLEFNGR